MRSISVDDVTGTTLYDGIVLSADTLAAESLPGRVIIVVTDGNETQSKASLDDAIKAARDAGAVVYVVAIESPAFTPGASAEAGLQTGGAYYPDRDARRVTAVYRTIADELTRTWRLEYVTEALPGEPIEVSAQLPGGNPEALDLGPPASGPRGHEGVRRRAPRPALRVRTGAGRRSPSSSASSSCSPRRSARQAARGLAQEPAGSARHAAPEGVEQGDPGRLALVSALSAARERVGHLKPWKRLQALLERADMPLRTVEFVYLMLASGLVRGSLFAMVTGSVASSRSGSRPAGSFPIWSSRQGAQAVKAFENQLPDMLATMAAGLKAGHSFRQALQSVVDEDQPPASREFQRVLAEARLGRPLDEALVRWRGGRVEELRVRHQRRDDPAPGRR